ncbi:MAG: CorA family divalent cation transporter, partial [Thermoanaerobaculia bacterium]
MLKTLTLDTTTNTFIAESPVADISELAARPELVVWTDVSDPTSQDFLDLAEEFGFHPLAIEDCSHGHQRPKIEEYKGYYFIVIYEARQTEEMGLELRELNIFLGKNYLVTVHSQPIAAIETATRVWPQW